MRKADYLESQFTAPVPGATWPHAFQALEHDNKDSTDMTPHTCLWVCLKIPVVPWDMPADTILLLEGMAADPTEILYKWY